MSYRRVARKYARRYFGPKGQALFMAQMGQESGFRGGQTSSAGAQGPAQLMPGTAAAWGVTNPNDPEQAYHAAARHMKAYLDAYGGSWDKALIAYNAGPGRVGGPLPQETVDYIHTIRANAGKYASGSGPQVSQGGDTSATTTTRTEPTFDQAGFEQAQRASTLGAMIAKRNPNSFLIRSGLLSLTPPNPAEFQGSRTVTSRTPGTSSGGRGSGAVRLGGGRAGAGSVKITGPNPGRIKPEAKAFLRKISAVYGRTIVGSDGTGHSYYTVNGNVSEHTTGNAVDIPARGRELIRMGRAALIAAGMPRKQAMQQTGGLFNVGNHQIIFNTQEGGDHTDHLHASTHARRRRR